MGERYGLLICLLSTLFLFACESQRPFYKKSLKAWEEEQLPNADGLSHIVFLIGDVGEPDLDPLEPTLRLLNRELQAAGENSSVIFLGNNIDPSGMPEENHPDRAEKEALLNAQLDVVKNHAGGAYFIPGNHDWNRMSEFGLTAVRRQEQYIEHYLGDRNSFLPNNGCGEPVAIEVNDDLTFILFDSQWWLQDWKDEEEIHQGCKVSSWDDLELELAELVDEYEDTNILIAMHHPIHTQGAHGGFFDLKEHIFPFTYNNENNFFPLPIIGSLHPVFRYLGITRQDPSHQFYQGMIDAVNEATFRRDDLVIASGHDHSLQYFHEDDKHYIVSGAGCKTSYIKPGFEAEFGVSQKGFAKVYYYKDGSVWSEFLTAEPQNGQQLVIFRRQLKGSKLKAPRDPNQEFEDIWQGMPDTVDHIIAPNYAASKSKRFWLGNHYRDAWTAAVKLPILNMDTIKGGIYPLRKGGGRQTLTMRLEGADEKEYVLRSLYKDASLSLPQFAQGTVLENIYQDQMSMDHPYGAMIIPPLAAAIGIYHTNPRFFYLLPQPRLGEFNDLFSHKAYLFEERPAKNREDVASFGRSEDIDSYRKMLKKSRDQQDHVLDQEHTLRSRLFDMLIGDWDRHDDQWRWATFEEGEQTIYRPVPRDRDHAFLSFRGVLPWLASRKWSIARQLQSFEHDFHDIRGLNFNARFFDRHYLNEQGLEDWKRAAEKIRTALTDSVIERAVNQWPEPLFAISGPEVIAKLKSRRDVLPEVAEKYYYFLARAVDIPGTDEQDYFEINRLAGGKTRVQIFVSNKEGEKKERWYDRTFDKKETKEVRLYGLKKDDIFKISGQSGANVLVRIIGGTGEDWVEDKSSVAGGKRTKVYDEIDDENRLELGTEGKDLTNHNPYDNKYDRKAFKYPKTAPIIVPEANPDDGFRLKFGLTRQLPGFRKDPYKAEHTFLGDYAFGTNALSLSYSGDFIDMIGTTDFTLDVAYRATTNVTNFFGLGNDSKNLFPERDNFDFNRIRYGQIRVAPGLKKRFALDKMKAVAQLIYTRTDVERTPGRISAMEHDELSGLTADDYSAKDYVGIHLGYHIDKTDHPQNPGRGMRFNLTTSWNSNLQQLSNNYLNLSTDLAIYYQPFSPFPLTLATRGGFAANYGGYEFFQANYLGRQENLRGFRANRFGGDSYLYANFEGRLKVFSLFGVIGFYDLGKVQYAQDRDNPLINNWHESYGGGVYLSIQNLVTFSATIAHSVENNFFEFKSGFFF